MTRLALTLDYQLAPGWLQPFAEGLINGQAVAWCCADCQRTSYPPVRTCICGQITGEWKTLSGEAIILHHTYGQDGQFALVQFEGADTSTVMKLHPPEKAQDWRAAESASTLAGKLEPQDSTVPALILHIHPIYKPA